MSRIAAHQTSRGDPVRLFCMLALIVSALPCAARAQDAPVGGPADSVARTAARALLGDEVPDDQIVPVIPAVIGGEPEGLFAEPRLIVRGIDFATRTLGEGDQRNNGFYPEFSNMSTGSGWVSIGPGYRHWFRGDTAIADASAAVSWRAYKMVQGRFEWTQLAHSRVAVGAQAMWQDQTQVTYFGEGSTSPASARSEYRIRTTDVVGYATAHPERWLAVTARLGWLARPTLSSPAGTFQRGNPNALDVFANDVAVALPDQPKYAHGELSLVADTRDSRSHPMNGGLYRASAAAFADRSSGALSFRRYEGEAAQFVSLAADTLTLVGHAWFVGTESDPSQTVPFYMLPSLGGHNTLRSFDDFRFHDRNLLVVNGEVRLGVLTHVDLAAFVDAGNVASRVRNLDLGKQSVGIGLQMHTQHATFARVDLAHGSDGWRLLFRTSDPFHLSRLSRRVAPVPFVP